MNRGLVLDPTRWLAGEESSQKSEPVASAVGGGQRQRFDKVPRRSGHRVS